MDKDFVCNAVFSDSKSCVLQELCSDRSYKIVVIRSGESILHVAQNEYVCTAPCMVILGIAEPYIFDIKSNIYERYVISISSDAEKEGVPNMFEIFDAYRKDFSHVIALKDDSDFVNKIAESIVNEVNSGKNAKADIWTSALICKLLNLSPVSALSPASQKDRIVASTRKTIEKNPALPFDLDDLATDSYISRFYLSHIFREITGSSIKSYILCCRLALACTLLCSPDTPIVKVAELSGFADMSNFSRYFKDILGITPSQYRRLALSDK